MKKSSKKEPKYVTEPVFEKHMASIARSFDRIEERLDKNDKMSTLILEELKGMREESHQHRLAMAGLTHTDVNHEHEIKGLKIRVERLERKIK
jgi:hypothetical protein